MGDPRLKPRCRECGDIKTLNESGVCRYRGGCEHRQFQHEARMSRLEQEMQSMDRTHAPGTLFDQFVEGIFAMPFIGLLGLIEGEEDGSDF